MLVPLICCFVGCFVCLTLFLGVCALDESELEVLSLLLLTLLLLTLLLLSLGEGGISGGSSAVFEFADIFVETFAARLLG